MTTLAECVTAPVQTVAVECVAYSGTAAVAALSLAGGSVTADGRRAVMRDASLEFAPSGGLSLEEAYDLLVTPGLELAVRRGFALADGTRLMADLGRFVPDEPQWRRGAAGESLQTTATDIAVKVQRARWSDPYVIAAGTSLASALAELLLDRYPPARHALTADLVPETLGAQVVTEAGEGSDPWQDACRLAGSFGYALYPDPAGTVVAKAVQAPTAGAPAFVFARGSTAIVTEHTRSSPLARTYNGVIATGEGTGTDAPVRGEAWDENPASPTYRHGPFGQVPCFYSSPLLTTVDQCEQAAAKILATCLGRVEQLSWSAAAHPGLQPFDTVRVEQADGSMRAYVLDCVTIPLGVGETMTAVAREVSA